MDDILNYNIAYFIRFSSIESSTYINNYVFPNLALILPKDAHKYIAIEEDESGNDCMVMFVSESIVDDLIMFCEEEKIVQQHFDITNKLLVGDSIPSVVSQMIISEEFKEVFDRFFLKNMTIDLVLEKISRSGEHSITEIDKKILNNGI